MVTFTAIVFAFGGAAAIFGLCMARQRSPAMAGGGLRADGIAQLARLTQLAIRSQGWQRFPEGAVIVDRAIWTGADLLHAIDRLFEAIDAEYEERSQRGRAARHVAHYDAGLHVIRDALRASARDAHERRGARR